ncbi:hypothetical protein FAGKG844_80087 [Frankia sp. AgKG'84/4]
MVYGPYTIGHHDFLWCRHVFVYWSSHGWYDTQASCPLLSIRGVTQPPNFSPAGKDDVQCVREIWRWHLPSIHRAGNLLTLEAGPFGQSADVRSVVVDQRLKHRRQLVQRIIALPFSLHRGPPSRICVGGCNEPLRDKHPRVAVCRRAAAKCAMTPVEAHPGQPGEYRGSAPASGDPVTLFRGGFVTPPSPSAGIPSSVSTSLGGDEVAHATSSGMDAELSVFAPQWTTRDGGDIPANPTHSDAVSGPWSRYRRHLDGRSTACLLTGCGPQDTPVRVPPTGLPVRRPGRHWIPPRPPRAIDFSISVLDEEGNQIENLVGWATAEAAEEHARSLSGVASYRIVSCRRIEAH